MKNKDKGLKRKLKNRRNISSGGRHQTSKEGALPALGFLLSVETAKWECIIIDNHQN
jgi:hypothetical protein